MTRLHYGAISAAAAAIVAADIIGAKEGYPLFDYLFKHEQLSNGIHNALYVALTGIAGFCGYMATQVPKDGEGPKG